MIAVQEDLDIQRQRKKIHPHKFTLWVAIGSIVMMFAGFTSAYIVKRNQSNWQGFDLPLIFTYSTIVMLVSSVTMQLALRKFKNRNLQAYRGLILLTALLGLAFIALQLTGFMQLEARGVKLIGQGSNAAGSFLGVIAGMHMAHVLGGVLAVFVMLIRAFRRQVRSYNAVPVEVMATYWHFVDLLWIYLFIFLSVV